MLFLSFAAFLVAQDPQAGRSPLQDELRRIIASSGADVAVAYRTLDGKTELLLDGDTPFHAASTM